MKKSLEELPINPEIQSYLPFQDQLLLASTNKAHYGIGLEGFFSIITVGHQSTATEKQKTVASKISTALYRRLTSKLSYFLPMSADERASDPRFFNLAQELKRLIALSHCTTPDFQARCQALRIGIAIALNQPVKDEELQYLNRLLNMPAYCLEGLLGLFPLLSTKQVDTIAAHFMIMKNLENLRDNERQLVWRVLTPFLSFGNFKMVTQGTLESDWKCEANSDFLVALVEKYPEFISEFTREALVKIRDRDSDIQAPIMALVTFFSKRSYLLTASIVEALVDKLNEKEGYSQGLGGRMHLKNQAKLIEALTSLYGMRPDLLGDASIRQRVRQTLLSFISPYVSSIGDFSDCTYAVAAKALARLSNALGIEEILASLLSYLDNDKDDKYQASALRALVALFEQNPELLTNTHFRMLEDKLELHFKHSKWEKLNYERVKAIAAFTKIKSEYLSPRSVLGILKMTNGSSWDNAIAMNALAVVFAKRADLLNEEAVRVILTGLGSKESSLQAAGARILVALIDKRPDLLTTITIKKHLLAIAADNDPAVRRSVLDALDSLCKQRLDLLDETILSVVRNIMNTFTTDHHLKDIALEVLASLYKKRPDLLNESVPQLILNHSMFSFTSIQAETLSFIFIKRPDLLNMQTLNEVWRKLTDVYHAQDYDRGERINKINNLIATLIDQGRDFLTENMIESVWLTRINDNNESRVRQATIAFLVLFFERHPDLLTVRIKQSILEKIHDRIHDVREAAGAFVMNVLMRSPMEIIHLQNSEGFFRDDDLVTAEQERQALREQTICDASAEEDCDTNMHPVSDAVSDDDALSDEESDVPHRWCAIS